MVQLAHAALRTVQEFVPSPPPEKWTEPKYCNSAVPCPIMTFMSQAAYTGVIGGPILFAIFAFLHVHINNRYDNLYKRAA